MPVTVKTSELPDNTAAFPTTFCTVKILDVKQEPSKKFAPMDTLECEVVAPATVKVGNANVGVAGRKFTKWIAYGGNALRPSIGELAKLGITVPEDLTLPTEEDVRSGALKTIPEIQELTRDLKGMIFDATVATEPRYKTDTGRWDGKRVLDEHGQPIVVGHNTVLVEIQGHAGPDVM